MDKNKSKGNKGEYRAAGKKRLEKFRQNRNQNKESSKVTAQSSKQEASREIRSTDFPEGAVSRSSSGEGPAEEANSSSGSAIPVLERGDEQQHSIDNHTSQVSHGDFNDLEIRNPKEGSLTNNKDGSAVDVRVIEVSSVKNKENRINDDRGEPVDPVCIATLANACIEEMTETVSPTMTREDTINDGDDSGYVHVLMDTGNGGIETVFVEMRGEESDGKLYETGNQSQIDELSKQERQVADETLDMLNGSGSACDKPCLDVGGITIQTLEECESANKENLGEGGENSQNSVESQQEEGYAHEISHKTGELDGLEGADKAVGKDVKFVEDVLESSIALVQRSMESKEAGAEFTPKQHPPAETSEMESREKEIEQSREMGNEKEIMPEEVYGQEQKLQFMERQEMVLGDELDIMGDESKCSKVEQLLVTRTQENNEIPTQAAITEGSGHLNDKSMQVIETDNSLVSEQDNLLSERLGQKPLQMLTDTEDRVEKSSSEKDDSRSVNVVIERGKVLEVKQELNKLKPEIEDISNMTAVSELESSNLSHLLQQSQEQKSELETEVVPLRLKMGYLEAENCKLASELAEARGLIKALEIDLAESSDGLKEAKCLLQSLQKKEHDANRAIELEGHLEGCKEELLEQRRETSLMKSLLDESEHKLQKISKERASFEQDCLDLRNQLQKALIEKGSLEGDLQVLQAEKENTIERNKILSSELEASHVCHDEGVAERLSIERKLAELEEKMQETMKENEELQVLKERLEASDIERLQAVSELSSLKQQLEPLQNEKSHLITLLESERQSSQLLADELMKVQKELNEKLKEVEQEQVEVIASSESIRNEGSEVVPTQESKQPIVERDDGKMQVAEATSQKLERVMSHRQAASAGVLGLIRTFEARAYSKSVVNPVETSTFEQESHHSVIETSGDLHNKVHRRTGSDMARVTPFEMSKLGESENGKGRLARSLSEADIVVPVKSEKEKLEDELTISMEKYKDLEEQASRYADNVQSLQSQVLELQQKRMDEVEIWQLKVGDLDRVIAEQAVAMKSERKAYMSSLMVAKNKRQNVQQSESSDDSLPVAGFEMVDIMNAIEQVMSEYSYLAASHENAAQALVQKQDERDKVAGMLRDIRGKLSQLSKQESLNEITDRGEEETKAPVTENELICLYQECNCYVNEIRACMEEKVLLQREASDFIGEIQSLQEATMDLRQKAADETLTWQLNMEDLQRSFSQQQAALKDERKAFLRSLIDLEHKMEKDGCDTQMVIYEGFPAEAEDVDMVDIMERVEKLKIRYEKLFVSEVEAQQQRQLAVQLMQEMTRKLFELIRQQQKTSDEVVGEAVIEGVFGADAELHYLNQEFTHLFSELQKVQDDEKTLLKEMQSSLSAKKLDVEETSVKLEALNRENESLKLVVAQETMEKLQIEQQLAEAKKMVETVEELYNGLIVEVNAATNKLLSLVDDMNPESDEGRQNMEEDTGGCLREAIRKLIEMHESMLKEVEAAKNGQFSQPSLNQASREAELSEKIDDLTTQLEEAKREKVTLDLKIQQTEQKLMATREKLSLAVSKGKGVVQQRDALKHTLEGKNEEMERMMNRYELELQNKDEALHQVEMRLRAVGEAGERVEALESELAYIRNSSNGLRESFLLKDAVLQRIEEMLDDVSLPEEIQSKEIVEKIEWLATCNTSQKLMSPAQEEWVGGLASQLEEAKYAADSLYAESAQRKLEFDSLNQKYEDLVHKYHDLAEQSAMLEQSLIERNSMIQKCEEALDSIEMPRVLRAGEPDERIEWLGGALKQERDSVNLLETEAQISRSTLDSLNHELEEARERVDAFSTEMIALKGEFEESRMHAETLSFEAAAKTQNIEKLMEDLDHASRECERLKAETEEKEQQCAILEELIANARTQIINALQETGDVASYVDVPFESCIQRMVEKHKACLQSSMETLNLPKVPMQIAERSMEIQGLQEGNALLTSDQNEKLEGAFSTIASMEAERDQLMQRSIKLEEEVSLLKEERGRLQSDLVQSEQKLSSIREKLSMAVKKGRTVLQQRDAIKQSLDEKGVEVDALKQALEGKDAELDAVRKELQEQHGTLQETKEMMRQLMNRVEHVKALELELADSKNYTANMEQLLAESNRAMQELVSTLDRMNGSEEYRSSDPCQKVEILFRILREAQKRVDVVEQEAERSKRGVELLANELDEVHSRMDSLSDDYAQAKNDLSTSLEEKEIAEAAKVEAMLRLEHVMVNLNSLLLEVSSLKDAKVGSDREIKSLNDALSSQVEELRQEQSKADLQNKLIERLQGNCCDLKEQLTGLLFKVMNGLSRKEEEVKTARSAMEALIYLVKSFGAGSLIGGEQVDLLSVPVRAAPLFHNEQQEEKNRGAGLWNSSRENVAGEGWHYDDDILAPLAQHVNEMQGNLKQCSSLLEDSLSSLSQETASILHLATETKNVVVRALEASNTNLAAVADEKAEDLRHAIAAVNSLGGAILSACERLNNLISDSLETENSREIRSAATCLEDWNREHGPKDKMSENLVNFIAHTCKKLSVSVEMTLASLERRDAKIKEELQLQFSLVEEHMKVQLAAKESECQDLKTQSSELEETIANLVSQRDSDESKIAELENLILNLNGEFDEMQQTLYRLQENEVSLGQARKDLELLQNVLTTKDQEQEALMQALGESDLKLKDVSKKAEQLEQTLHQKQAIIENLEASRSKALSKLSATLRKLDDIRKLSEGLLVEVENLQSQVENRELEIDQLKQVVASSTNEVLTLRKTVDVRSSDMLQLQQQLQCLLFESGDENPEAIPDSVAEESLLYRLVEGLQEKISNLASKSEALHSQLEKKNSLMLERDIRLKESTEMVATLQATLEEERANFERLIPGGSSSASGGVSLASEIEELGQKGVRSLPHMPVASQVLSARKPSAVDPHQAVDVDLEAGSSKLDEDDNDKGHAFRPLTSSRLVPHASRFFSDRFDGLWVASGRMLMRQPEARLGLALYWLAMHLWIMMAVF